jgi:hypothetical protein
MEPHVLHIMLHLLHLTLKLTSSLLAKQQASLHATGHHAVYLLKSVSIQRRSHSLRYKMDVGAQVMRLPNYL